MDINSNARIGFALAIVGIAVAVIEALKQTPFAYQLASLLLGLAVIVAFWPHLRGILARALVFFGKGVKSPPSSPPLLNAPLALPLRPSEHQLVVWRLGPDRANSPELRSVVKNQSDKTISAVEVSLVKIERLDSYGQPYFTGPLRLSAEGGGERIDVPPGREQAFRLCWARWPKDKLDSDEIDRSACVLIAPGSSGEPFFPRAGNYRLTVTASGRDTPPESRTYEIVTGPPSFSLKIPDEGQPNV